MIYQPKKSYWPLRTRTFHISKLNIDYRISWIIYFNSSRPSDAYMRQLVNDATTGSDHSLSAVRWQAIIWTTDGSFIQVELIPGTLGSIFAEKFEPNMQYFSFKKIYLKCRLQNDTFFASGSEVLNALVLFWINVQITGYGIWGIYCE